MLQIIKTYFSKYVDAKQNISLELFKQFLLKEQKVWSWQTSTEFDISQIR